MFHLALTHTSDTLNFLQNQERAQEVPILLARCILSHRRSERFASFWLVRHRTYTRGVEHFANQNQRRQAFQWGIEAADANNVNLAAFSHKIVILNVSIDHGKTAGGVVFGYEDTRPLEPTFFFHEMGHEFGLDDSWEKTRHHAHQVIQHRSLLRHVRHHECHERS